MASPWIETWFEQVKKLRGGLMSADQWDRLDPKTQHLYKAKFAALGGKLPSDVAKCKKSYYSARAAWQHVKSRETRDALNKMDKWLREVGSNAVTQEAFLVQSKALGLPALIHDWKEFTNAKFTGSVRGVVQPTHGKRKIANLPKEWKTELLCKISNESKYKLPVVVMALTGCRPSEFENGVYVNRLDQDTYKISITGKKQGERTHKGKTFTTGQSLRVLTFTRGDGLGKNGQVNPEFIFLDKLMKDANGKPCVYKELAESATAIRDVVIRASRKAFPDLENKPTAYSFRHAVASELKAMNGERSAETAAFMGHASAKTQSCYGYRQSGGGGAWTCTATASGDIRHTEKKATYTRKRRSKIAGQVSRCVTVKNGGANVGDVTLAKLSGVKAAVKSSKVFVHPKPAPPFARGMRLH